MNGILLTALAGLLLVLPLTTITDSVNNSRNESQQRQLRLINRIAETLQDGGRDYLVSDTSAERHDASRALIYPVE